MKTCFVFWAAGITVSALLVSGCGRTPESPASTNVSPAVVRVQTVESKQRVATEEVVGTVRARLHSVIEAKISGRIEKMLGVPGQNAKTGGLLVQLDAREVQAQLDRALAVRQQTENDLKRATNLFQQNILA
jgi:membrane fusion protein, multidrug efflux system